MKKAEKEKRKKWKKTKKILADKINMISLVFFILSIFLLDVNSNMIGAYGKDIQVNFIAGIKFYATSMFWLGFIAAAFFFFLVSTRSLYHKRKYPKLDLFFAVIGAIGLMIILSGGMILFWLDNGAIIPFFGHEFTRIAYYHTGIGLELVTMIYFAITK